MTWHASGLWDGLPFVANNQAIADSIYAATDERFTAIDVSFSEHRTVDFADRHVGVEGGWWNGYQERIEQEVPVFINKDNIHDDDWYQHSLTMQDAIGRTTFYPHNNYFAERRLWRPMNHMICSQLRDALKAMRYLPRQPVPVGTPPYSIDLSVRSAGSVVPLATWNAMSLAEKWDSMSGVWDDALASTPETKPYTSVYLGGFGVGFYNHNIEVHGYKHVNFTIFDSACARYTMPEFDFSIANTARIYNSHYLPTINSRHFQVACSNTGDSFSSDLLTEWIEIRGLVWSQRGIAKTGTFGVPDSGDSAVINLSMTELNGDPIGGTMPVPYPGPDDLYLSGGALLVGTFYPWVYLFDINPEYA